MPPRLLLLGRPDCGLCEDLLQELRQAFGPDAFAVEQADVDSRPDWSRRYGLKVPVLLDAWGEPVSSGHLDRERLAEYLAAAGGAGTARDGRG